MVSQIQETFPDSSQPTHTCTFTGEILHIPGSRFLRSRRRHRPRASLALSTSLPPAPQQHRRGQRHSPQRDQELCGAETTFSGAGTWNATRCPPVHRNHREPEVKAWWRGPLQGQVYWGEISSLCCSPSPFLTDPRKQQGEQSQKSFLRFNTQNPGSSIKQQKLNVISSRGTATLLTVAQSDSLSLSDTGTQPGERLAQRRGEEGSVLQLTTDTSTERDGHLHELKGTSDPSRHNHTGQVGNSTEPRNGLAWEGP